MPPVDHFVIRVGIGRELGRKVHSRTYSTWSMVLPQVKSPRILAPAIGVPCALRLRRSSRRVTERKKPLPPPRLRLVRVHRIGLVIAASRMRHMVRGPAQAAPGPAVVDVEYQRRLRP